MEDTRLKKKMMKKYKKDTIRKKNFFMPMDSEETWKEKEIEKETSPLGQLDAPSASL